jgi:UDP-galactopyranose mutase
VKWVGGFEGADHINGSGTALSMGHDSGHLSRLDGDYRRLRRLGFSAVRESLGWRVCESAGAFDFRSLHARMQAAERQGLEIRWTLMHYGVPADMDLLDQDEAGFINRFARFCEATAVALSIYSSPTPRIVTPINELSFLSWAATHSGLFHPHRGDRPGEADRLKTRLIRAALAGCRAYRRIDPAARMMWVEPLIHVSAPHENAALRAEALNQRESQFEVLDALTGRERAWLGGSPEYVDLIGVNYYHSNQWEAGSNRPLHWHHADPLRSPLSRLLRNVHQRYQLPMTISETSHVGTGRSAWLREIASQVRLARDSGVDIEGVCLYPVMDRPDWETPTQWHQSGLWEVDPAFPLHPPALLRDYANAYRDARRSLAAPITSSPGNNIMHQLLVFSHLRWDFVYQRPQHLLSRFGQRWAVVFFEEPVHDAGCEAWLEELHPCIGVTVLRAHTPIAEPGFADAQFPLLSALLQEWLADHREEGMAAWLYTPMALPLVQGLEPGAIIYDCMDQLGAFKNAPERLMDRERTLLEVADVVFTGGPSLQDAKAPHNANVLCFASSVDVAHFAQGRRELEPASQGAVPRLGFFGVLDERLDLDLIDAVARAHPTWQIDLVGPVVKIDPTTLPRAANLNYLGQRDYAELPGLIADWDVCLLPFAMNASTAFISPTKTLEYMAARKPVVTTPVRDVIRLYAEGVQVAHTHSEFIAACEMALREDEEGRRERIAVQDKLTRATSWDHTAEAMAGNVLQAMTAGLNVRAKAYLAGDHVVSMEEAPVQCLILGAGPTGLSAAYHYGPGSVLVEREQSVGGWCRSLDDQGFRFDHAGHIMFSNDPDVLKLYETLLGDNLHWQNREAWVYSKGVHTRYPFQGALYGLPPAVLKECLVGAIEARFGPLEGAGPSPMRSAKPAATSALKATAPAANDAGDCCADGSVPDAGATGDPKDLTPSANVASFARRGTPANFEEFIYQVWGAGVAKHFAVPYNVKLWTVPLREMETSWLGGRVPMPNLDEMIEGALEPVAAPVGPNARFGYPLRGGFQALMDGFLPLLEGKLALGKTATAVSVRRRQVTFSDGQRMRWQELVTTLPLPEFVRLIGDEAPERVRQAAAGLRHVSVRCVNLGIGRADLTDKHWIYYPEDTIFHRIFVQGNASPHNNPPGGFGLTCEITYSPTKPLPVDGDALIERCIRECIEVGMMRPEDPVLTSSIVDMPYAYVLYDHARAANVETIRSWLLTYDIVLAGRYSEWEYYNSDHAFLAGRRAAEQVRTSLTQRKAGST